MTRHRTWHDDTSDHHYYDRHGNDATPSGADVPHTPTETTPALYAPNGDVLLWRSNKPFPIGFAK